MMLGALRNFHNLAETAISELFAGDPAPFLDAKLGHIAAG
jgi:hypothetical protein